MKNSVIERLKAVEEEVKAIKEEMSTGRFKGLGVEDTFSLIGVDWKILGITDEGYLCRAESIDDSMKFGNCNDWKKSVLRKHLNTEVYEKICAEIGEENVIEFERDLTSLDGQTEYGKCMDKVSLINVDEYRKYRSMIPNAEKWWWTITPWSTECNDDSDWLSVVSPSGIFVNDYYDYDFGVRPVCIFSSALFES